MADKYVLTDKREGIGTIILNDPAKMNALSRPLADALIKALEEMWYDDTVRVVIVRGSGGIFCAGGDVKGMKERVDCYRQGIKPATDPRNNLRNLNRIVTTIRKMDKPLIAWIEGVVAGGGVSLALASDFSIADESCRFAFAFANIGLAPDMGSSFLLAQKVGVPKATELFMLGSSISGCQAADWGVITEAVPRERLEERVMELAHKLAVGPSRSYAAIKASLNRVMYQGLDDIMEAEVEMQYNLTHTEDHMEAVTAFIEKRKPVFKGR